MVSSDGVALGPVTAPMGTPAVQSACWFGPVTWSRPRELRHTFVSLLSDNGMAIEEISRLMGHSSSNVTETVYRHQIRPVITDGAEAMDKIFANEH